MADFRPFRGWRYNQEAAGDLAQVICPPYDLINPEMEESLRRKSPFNVVHLEGGEAPHPAGPGDDPYARAAALFGRWQREGVLRRDQEPCFYLVRHGFSYGGKDLSRLELYGCLRVEPYETRQVLPHEFTRPAPVQDRVRLMQAAQANFSPIMSLYRDREGVLAPVWPQVTSGTPAAEAHDDAGGRFTMWRVTAPSLQQSIRRALGQEAVFLADGHHRYEAALQFQRLAGGPARDQDAAGNFVMMALISFDDPGLMVLPYHRVLKGLSPEDLEAVRRRLDVIFESQPVDLAADPHADALVARVASLGRRRQVMGLVAAGGAGRLLSLREGADRSGWGPLAVSEAWVLEEQVLKPVLGEAVQRHISYVHDHQGAVAQTASGVQQLAFLLRPFPLDRFEAIVGQGQRLPPKSTFFYPKLATGLVISQLSGPL
jgi:uncharacterized protein (DUF1015 family)